MTNAQGIDISKWQTATPSLAGLDFAFARATYGTTIDTRYLQHSAAIRKAGLVLGAYHFGRSGQYASIKSQAALFLFKSTGADLLALDFESDGVRNTAMSRVEAADFIAKVHAAGHSIGLYHSDSGFPSDLGEDWRWVAKWSKTPPSRKWDIWQYRGSPLDLDEFHGTPDELQVFAGLKLPDSSTGDTVRDFDLIYGTDGRLIAGTLRVRGDAKHKFLRLAEGTLGDALTTWAPKDCIAIKLTEDITSTPHPGVDRRTGYLIGDNAAFMLAQDVDFTPYPDATPYSQADMDKAARDAVARDRVTARIVWG